MQRIARSGIGTRGEPLPFLDELQAAFGPEHDLSSVRAHIGGAAAGAATALSASAYAYGDDIAFARRPTLPETAHEAMHVIQQRRGVVDSLGDLGSSGAVHEREAHQFGARVTHGGGAPHAFAAEQKDAPNPRPAVQRALLVSESTPGAVDRFRALMEPATGLRLGWDPGTRVMNAVGSLGDPTSPTFAFNLTSIMDDSAQDAELNFGEHQPNVEIGAFPTPDDLSGDRVQNVDMDDVEAIEAGAPGHGVAFLGHEIWENYQAHHMAIEFGGPVFEPAHEDALVVESQVVEDLIGPGERVAEVDIPLSTGGDLHLDDYGGHYLAYDRVRSGTDVEVSNARILPKLEIAAVTIDHFDFGSSALPTTPATGGLITALTLMVTANAFTTLRVEGFTDSVGDESRNVGLALDRANAVLRAIGIDLDRVHVVPRGEEDPVAPNDTPANRALNRRVVVRIGMPVF
jgi:flagellar motor protein MotB